MSGCPTVPLGPALSHPRGTGQAVGEQREKVVCPTVPLPRDGFGGTLPAPGSAGQLGTSGTAGTVGTVGDWQRAVAGLDPTIPPCPGFRRWPATVRAMKTFVVHHAEAAIRLGWDALGLFGIHPVVGAVRPDCCGALTTGEGWPVVALTADAVGYGNRLVYRRAPWPSGVTPVPVWEFGR